MSGTVPIFNPEKLGASLSKAADKAVQNAITEAKAWVVESRDDFEALGEDLVNAILFKVAFESAKQPVLPPDAPQEAVTEAEAILAHNDLCFSLIAKAQKEHSERISRVEKSAGKLVLKVGTVGVGLILRGLVGA